MVLKNKTILITGGSSGIGRACVEAFAEQGANVIINYAHDKNGASEAADAASKYGVKTLVIQADITKQAEVDAMFDKIKAEFSSLDVVVNNAGIFAEDDSPDNFEVIQKIFDIDFFAQIRVTNAARQLMDKGKIVFISSIHGRLGHGRPTAIGYSASKAALDSYMKNLTKAVAPNILVNSIAPGRTAARKWGELDEEHRAERAAEQFINRQRTAISVYLADEGAVGHF